MKENYNHFDIANAISERSRKPINEVLDEINRILSFNEAYLTLESQINNTSIVEEQQFFLKKFFKEYF